MRTLAELKAYFKKHNFQINRDPYEDSGYKFNVGGVKRTVRDTWGSHRFFEGGEYVGCSVGQATWCCGVDEIGDFTGQQAAQEHWEAIFEYVIQHKKLDYVRTETITHEKQNLVLDEALKNVGFKLVTTLASKHGKRNKQVYDIHVWEWLRPKEDQKT